jgi:hypothetical protein
MRKLLYLCCKFENSTDTFNILPMKNLFLLLVLGFAMMASASTYNYLVFTNQAGTTTAFSVNNLTLKVNGSDLQVTNDEGSVNLVLTELASMQFSVDKTVAGVENILHADAPVQVHSVTGIFMGTYNSMIDAAKCLNMGTYVISSGNQSQTVVIK